MGGELQVFFKNQRKTRMPTITFPVHYRTQNIRKIRQEKKTKEIHVQKEKVKSSLFVVYMSLYIENLKNSAKGFL